MYAQNQNVLPYVSIFNYVTKSLSEYIRNDSDEIKINNLVKEICMPLKFHQQFKGYEANDSLTGWH